MMDSRTYRSLLEQLESKARQLTGARTDKAIGLDGTNNLLQGYLFLLFERDRRAPAVFVKLTDSAGLQPVLETEHDNLRILRERMPAELLATLPEPLWQGTIDRFYATIRTALDGETLKNVKPSKHFSRRRTGRTLERISEWLLCFYKAMDLSEQAASPDRAARRNRAREYLDRFIPAEAESDLVIEAWERVDEACRQGLPLVARHWDLCTANVIELGTQFGIIDWEMRFEPSLPLFDLFYFCSSTRCLGSGICSTGSHFESFKQAFFHDNYLSRAVRIVIGSHAQRLEVPLPLIPYLLVTALTELALMKYRTVLESHLLDPEQFPGGEPGNEEKRKRWCALPLDEMDLPMCRISKGACLTVRCCADEFDRMKDGWV